MKELENYKKAIEGIDEFLDDIQEHAAHGDITSHPEILKQAIRLMLNDARDFVAAIKSHVMPPPELEEVEVVRWLCTSCDEVYDYKPLTAECGAKLNERGNVCDGTEYVKLTGTLKRPKPQSVERTCPLKLDGNGWAAGGPNSKGLVLDRLPISGFFTWTEDPK